MCFHKIIFTASLLAAAIISASCGSDSGSSPTSFSTPDAPEVTGLSTPSPLDVQLSLDSGSAATVAITAAAGGTVEATAADGTRYVLTIPDDALLADTEITMTPVTAAEGVPVEGGKLVGVDLEPEGLRFYSPATLTVHPAEATGPVEAISFSYLGDGEDLHLYPPVNDPETLSFNIFHFSGHIGFVDIGEGTQLTAEGPELTVEPDSFNPSDWEAQFEHEMGELLSEERNADLRGEEGNPQFQEILEGLVRDYYFQIISGLLPGIRSDCAQAKANSSKVLDWARQVELLGMGETFSNESSSIMDAVFAGADNCWEEAIEPCLDVNDGVQMREAIGIARMNILMGGSEDKYNPFDPELHCSGCTDVIDIEAWEGQVQLTFSDSATDGNYTLNIDRSLTGTLDLSLLGPPIPGPDGKVTQVRYTGDVTNGQTAVSEVLSSSGSTVSVTGEGEPAITSVGLAVRPEDCTYTMTVQWSTEVVHSSTGITNTGSGGQIKLTGSLPAGDKQPVLAGTKAVPTYYLPGRMPETPTEFFTLFGTFTYRFPEMTGSDRFADTNVTWSLSPASPGTS